MRDCFLNTFRCALRAFYLSITMLVCSPVHATEYSRTLTVTAVAAVSASRPSQSATQGIFRVYATPAVWGSSNCRPDAADMSMDDWHIYPVLMRAWKEGMQITITVENTILLVSNDTVCKIVAVTTN